MKNPEVENNFTYHAPKKDQVVRYQEIRNMGKEFTYYLLNNCPSSRERSIAFTRIEEAIMWANAAIARHE